MKAQQEVPYAQWRGCVSKKVYPTEEEAWNAAARVQYRTGVWMVAYLCPFGKHYHTATRRKRKK